MSLVEDMQLKRRGEDKAKRSASEHQIQTMIDGKYVYIDAGEVLINGKTLNQFMVAHETKYGRMDFKLKEVYKFLGDTMGTFNEAVDVMMEVAEELGLSSMPEEPEMAMDMPISGIEEMIAKIIISNFPWVLLS